jgi:hypothetical protein
MSLGATKHFCVYDFTSGHFDKRRPAQEDLRLVFDKDAVIRQGRMVGASSR